MDRRTLIYPTSESIWKLANGTGTELWSGLGARIFGGPAIAPDGRSIAFSVRQHGQTLLYVMEADGTNARIVAESLDLQGAPAWAPDGQSITSAADDHGVPHLFRVPVDGRSPTLFFQEYAVDPAWAPDGRFVLYSGPDIGTTFSVKAVTAEAAAHPLLPALTLTRGARHLTFLHGGRALVLLRGEIQHKNLWLIDLETGAERQLTNLLPDFDIRDFDISKDGAEVVVGGVVGSHVFQNLRRRLKRFLAHLVHADRVPAFFTRHKSAACDVSGRGVHALKLRFICLRCRGHWYRT